MRRSLSRTVVGYATLGVFLAWVLSFLGVVVWGARDLAQKSDAIVDSSRGEAGLARSRAAAGDSRAVEEDTAGAAAGAGVQGTEPPRGAGPRAAGRRQELADPAQGAPGWALGPAGAEVEVEPAPVPGPTAPRTPPPTSCQGSGQKASIGQDSG
jgi:hypothetical protein